MMVWGSMRAKRAHATTIDTQHISKMASYAAAIVVVADAAAAHDTVMDHNSQVAAAN